MDHGVLNTCLVLLFIDSLFCWSPMNGYSTGAIVGTSSMKALGPLTFGWIVLLWSVVIIVYNFIDGGEKDMDNT